LKPRINAALVRYERDCKQKKHDNEYDALFVLGEFENTQQAFHFIVARLGLSFRHFSLSHRHGTVLVMLSEALQRNAKHEARLSNISDLFPVNRSTEKLIRD
jgi:hypothetical protein